MSSRHYRAVRNWPTAGWSAATISALLADGALSATTDSIACKAMTAAPLLERKKLHAVAEFIVRYVAFIGDVLSRHRARAFRITQSRMTRSRGFPPIPVGGRHRLAFCDQTQDFPNRIALRQNRSWNWVTGDPSSPG